MHLDIVNTKGKEVLSDLLGDTINSSIWTTGHEGLL